MTTRTQLLFSAAFHRVAATRATTSYLLEKSREFAAAIPDSADDAVAFVYASKFADRFGPGMVDQAASVLQEAFDEAELISLAFDQATDRDDADSVRRVVEAGVQESLGKGRLAAREDHVAKVEQSKAAAQAKEDRDEKLLNPKSYRDILIEDVDFAPHPKRAMLAEGLTTLGDVEDYNAARPLADIKGVSEEAGPKVMEMIAEIKAKTEG